MALNKRREQSQRSGGEESERSQQHLDFVADQEFNPPLLGLYRGRYVKVHARGNTKGMSSTLWISTENAKNRIVSLTKVTMVDSQFIAPEAQQIERILGGEPERFDEDETD